MNIKINKKAKLPLMILVIGVVLFVLIIATKPRTKAKPIAERAWLVKTQVLEAQNHIPSVKLHGIIEAYQISELKAPIDEEVLKTNVKEGEIIKPGQVLILLDPEDSELKLQQAASDIKNIKAQIQSENIRFQSDKKAVIHEKKILKLNQAAVKRQVDLGIKQYSSKSRLDEAELNLQKEKLALVTREQNITDHQNRLKQLEAQLLRANAALKQAKLELHDTQIKAPYYGKVIKLNVAPGHRAQQGENIISVYDLNSVEVRAQIPASYLNQIQLAIKNKKYIIAHAVIDNVKIKLTLDRLASEVSSGRSGIDGLFKVENNTDKLTLGRTIAFRLFLPSQKHTYAVPPSAIYNGNRVYIVKNNRLKRISIRRLGSTLIDNKNNWVLIQNGALKNGDKLVTTHLPNAIDGLKVSE